MEGRGDKRKGRHKKEQGKGKQVEGWGKLRGGREETCPDVVAVAAGEE